MSTQQAREPIEHDLKIWSQHFEAVLSGKKKAEYRINDRDFRVGDTLMLREVNEPECEYTGRKTYVTVTHIISSGEMSILSIEPQDTVAPSPTSDHIHDAEKMVSGEDSVIDEKELYHNIFIRLMAAKKENVPILEVTNELVRFLLPHLRTTEPVSRKTIEERLEDEAPFGGW